MLSGMSTSANSIELTGKLLIAMPQMTDSRFANSVVFLCQHSADGAMGLIINKPMPEVSFAEMLAQLEIDGSESAPNMPICYGGPVGSRRGFVLHSAEYEGWRKDGLKVNQSFAMTATLDVLEDIANRRGPEQALMTLGYAGWGAGQLESEIQHNGWLTTDATEDLVFDRQMEQKWQAALATLGVNPVMLSTEAGNA
jgi:putative transcriptional regulator